MSVLAFRALRRLRLGSGLGGFYAARWPSRLAAAGAAIRWLAGPCAVVVEGPRTMRRSTSRVEGKWEARGRLWKRELEFSIIAIPAFDR